MSYYLVLTLNLFIIVPAIAGLVRFSKVNPIFFPFFISIWVSACNTIFGGLIVQFGYYNTVHYNIWFLLDAYIYLWVFKKWNLFESNKSFLFLWIGLSTAWLFETIFFSKLVFEYNSYFRILYCFVVVLLSINRINYLLMGERKSLYKNPMFIICCTLVLLNTITVLAESFFAFNLQLGAAFRIKMERMIVFTGLICNLVYTLAILWMPKKQAFILQY